MCDEVESDEERSGERVAVEKRAELNGDGDEGSGTGRDDGEVSVAMLSECEPRRPLEGGETAAGLWDARIVSGSFWSRWIVDCGGESEEEHVERGWLVACVVGGPGAEPDCADGPQAVSWDRSSGLTE